MNIKYTIKKNVVFRYATPKLKQGGVLPKLL